MEEFPETSARFDIMDVPNTLRANMRALLLSKPEGIYLDQLCREYETLINKSLYFRDLGYHNLEAFVRAIPDIARLEYCVKERRMKVLGFKPLARVVNPGDDAQQPFEGRCSATGNYYRMGPANHAGPNSYRDLTQDPMGLYTVCFKSWRKMEMDGTLLEKFSRAGRVHEIHETQRWIYVRYYDRLSAERSFHLFGDWDLKPAVPEFFDPKQADTSNKRTKTSHPYRDRRRDREREVARHGPSYRVYVGNLDPNRKYTFDMFRKLFHDYKIGWVTLKPYEKEGEGPKLFAYALASNRAEAERLVENFNGYVWFGRPLDLQVKEKKPRGLHQMDHEGEGPDAGCKMPGLESAMPGLEPAMPGLESAMPGLEPSMPGLESAMPGLEPSMPGLESAIPGLEPAMPGLEPSMPGLESARPGLESARPGLESARPGLESARPGLEPVKQFEVPTILVANFKEEVEEATLRSHFAAFNPKSVRMMPTQVGRKKAYMELGSIEDVQRAVHCVNQTLFMGSKLKVDVPFHMPQLREMVFGRSAAQDLQPPALTGGGSGSGSMTLSEVLKMRGSMLQILQPREINLQLGQTVEVFITTVISDKFFWGQITNTRAMNELHSVTDQLNQPGQTERASGPGPCKALFKGDGKWYRAWVMQMPSFQPNQCRVFYLDYGNTAELPWSCTAKAGDSRLWDLQPMAVPITLTEAVTNLKERELSNIMVEVNALGTLEEGNMIVARATSLVPGLKAAVSSIGNTVIM